MICLRKQRFNILLFYWSFINSYKMNNIKKILNLDNYELLLRFYAEASKNLQIHSQIWSKH